MKEPGGYKRLIGPGERLWLAFEQEGMTISVALGIDGIGDISDEQMNNALRILADTYPICRSKLKGCLSSLRWEETGCEIPFIRIRPDQIKGPLGDWPQYIEKKILRRKMNLRKEIPMAVYSLNDGKINRLYLKMHHVAMDGLSVFLIVLELFRILRGEMPLGPTDGPESREDLYDLKLPKDYFQKRTLDTSDQPQAEAARKEDTSILFPGLDVGRHLIGPPSHYDCIQWHRLLIPWDRISPKSLNGKILYAILEAFYELNPGLRSKKVLSSMAVDLRMLLMPGLRKAANLTGLIMVEPSKYENLPLPERIQAIQKDIRESVEKGLAYRKHPAYINLIPVWLFRLGIHIIRKIIFKKKRFPFFYPFTSVGRYALADFSAPTYQAARAWPFGILQIGYPLFPLLISHDSGVDLTLMTDTDDRPGFERFIDMLQKKIDWAENVIKSAEQDSQSQG
jgi:hypothetical protein